MKKWSIIVGVFILFFVKMNVQASSWMFLWDEATTTVEIPLGGNLQNYLSIPKATLYRDGMPLSDADIHYITTGDWLYLLTDVDTHKAGNYQVWYKAVEEKYKPGQCQGYKTLITFKVVDIEKPKFLECPTEFIYLLGTPKPNFLEQISATDDSGNCEVSLDDSRVDYETPGTYSMFAYASDGYNRTTQEIQLHIQDPIGPVITFLGENQHILLTKGEEVNLQKYFKAVDKVDGDVTSTISYPEFDLNQEGTFELEVSFHDKNNNTSSIKVQIEIVNKDEIKIELVQKNLIAEYNKDFMEVLRSNIKNAYYGNQDIRDYIEIDAENVKNEVGSYIVTYSYEIQEKVAKEECVLKLLANSAPILLVENISVQLNQKPKILDYINVQDSSDPDIQSKVEYNDSFVDYQKPGSYPVLVTVTNSSGLSSTETLFITICESKSQLDETTTPLWLIPFILVIGISIGIVLFVYFRKKRNCNKNQNQL